MIPIIERYHIKFATVVKILVVIIQVVFLVFIAINSRIAADVSVLEKNVRALETSLTIRSKQSQEIQIVIDKITKLKKLEKTSPRLADTVFKLFKYTPNPEVLSKLDIRPSVIQISTETENPLEVSAIISSLLENNIAQEISIKTAYLSIANKKFISTLELTLK
ncbi:hypothetical protein HYV31_00460 [candidate division WWE3 bacterium]|nr:hypothetical protein [candidate division WWE3 bacterium]